MSTTIQSGRYTQEPFIMKDITEGNLPSRFITASGRKFISLTDAVFVEKFYLLPGSTELKSWEQLVEEEKQETQNKTLVLRTPSYIALHSNITQKTIDFDKFICRCNNYHGLNNSIRYEQFGLTDKIVVKFSRIGDTTEKRIININSDTLQTDFAFVLSWLLEYESKS